MEKLTRKREREREDERKKNERQKFIEQLYAIEMYVRQLNSMISMSP